MPIYEYRCDGCKKRYEVLVGVVADSDRSCPHCGRPEGTRVPSRFAVTAFPIQSQEGTAAGRTCCGGGSCGCGGG